MTNLFSKILFYLSSFSLLPPPKEKQLRVLKIVGGRHESAPVFLRNSLRQYDCQRYYFLPPIWLGFNFFSGMIFIPILVLLLLRSWRVPAAEVIDDISLFPKVPAEIREKFGPFFKKKPFGYLRARDWSYVLLILRHSGIRPYFWLRAVWKLGVYSELLDTYSPKRVWVTQEMVFESSLLTSYLSSFGVEHNNFMHGENFFSIQIAFSTFKQFYIWDEYYAELFKSLFVSAERFVTFSALENRSSSFQKKRIVKYYNQDCRNPQRLNRVIDNLLAFAKNRRCELVVRLHPRHQRSYEIKTLRARGVRIEDNAIDIVDSITEAEYVCSEFSSVLYIASLLDRPIVIDNTFPERMNLIKELEPIFINKLPHEFLITDEGMSRR